MSVEYEVYACPVCGHDVEVKHDARGNFFIRCDNCRLVMWIYTRWGEEVFREKYRKLIV